MHFSDWTWWVGYRYLKSKKNSRFLSFITVTSIFGLGLGVIAMIVVMSVMDGFELELKKRLMSSDLHILITPQKTASTFDRGLVKTTEFDSLTAEIQKMPGVTHVWPVVNTEVILKSGKKASGVHLKGINHERMRKLKEMIVESAEPQMLSIQERGESVRLPGIILGQELAYDLSIIPGDLIMLISPTETEGPMNNVPRMKRFVVEGVYRSGIPEQELTTIFATDQAVRSFLRKSGVYSQWEISVENFENAPQIAKKILPLAPHTNVKSWVELNSHLFASLKLERIAMFIGLAFIVIVASFNIVTTLTLMVLEKKKEISILKTMGAKNREVGSIFLAEGLFIGLVGISGGVVIGAFLCFLLKRYQFITLPDVYYDQTLPVTFDGAIYMWVIAASSLIVLLACWYPSKRAAQLNPIDGIRFG